MSGEPPDRRWFAWMALGSAAFTFIGSLVPFEFQGRVLNEAFSSFCWAMSDRAEVQSRSDGIANVLLGVPLGFALFGYLCVDRVLSLSQMTLSGLAVLAACVAFAAAVEFIQLFVPVRTCAGSDVLAQGLGAIIGILGWLVFGQRLANVLQEAAAANGAAGRYLVAYVLMLGFIQAIPLDLTLSPYQAYYKFRDGNVRVIPFGEFHALSLEERCARAAELIKLAGLYLPAGLLAGSSAGRFWALENFARVLLAAFALAVSLELGQVLVKGRTTNATDAIVGGLAAFLGWLLVKTLATRRA